MRVCQELAQTTQWLAGHASVTSSEGVAVSDSVEVQTPVELRLDKAEELLGNLGYSWNEAEQDYL